MNGFLLVNKEKGYSSNEIVQKIKKKFSLNKVGHLGTLDPDAEGLLIIAINRATKFSNYFLAIIKFLPKVYFLNRTICIFYTYKCKIMDIKLTFQVC